MLSGPLTDEFLTSLLSRLMSRYGGEQVFLFGPEGEPFWAAHIPLSEYDLSVLSDALSLLESLEEVRTKPFMGRDQRGRFTVAALDEVYDLYVVVLTDGLDRLAAEARVAAYCDELRNYAEPIHQRIVASRSATP